ncbi:hypothetical protein [Deinococcus sonorensis]|uniref:Uncharacterized protein n=2 Tax=Deinococcus sonorensis TaxID=309891 RepID=A0AAU7UBN5_9DEIO
MRVQIGRFSVQLWQGVVPAHLDQLMQRSDLAETHGHLNGRQDEDGALFCAAVTPDGGGWPALFVAQRSAPDVPGFDPGVLIVPETGLVLIGAGERLLAYRLDDPPVRLWEDHTEVGFWWWDRQGEVVLMAAELELAAWDLSGRKRWSMFVEPPWSSSVQNDHIHLNVMNHLSQFSLAAGSAPKEP